MSNNQIAIESALKNRNPIYELRKRGFKVRVYHNRYIRGNFIHLITSAEIKKDKLGKRLDPCGGKTVIEITTPDGVTLSGETKCNPIDNFNPRIAHRICLGRIVSKIAKELQSA